MELRAGIEPALSPWQGDVIPLDQRSGFRISNLKSGIRSLQLMWCWRKDSNLHQTGFEPVTSTDWVTPAHNHASRFTHQCWYRRRDSNPHQLVSKTSASARLGHAGTFEDRELRIEEGWRDPHPPIFHPRFLVGPAGLEPATSSSASLRSDPLSYGPGKNR